MPVKVFLLRSTGWVLCATLSTLVAGCPDREAQRQARIREELLSDKTVPVTFVSPAVGRIESRLEVTGPLKTLDQVQLGARATGRLVFVGVQEGSRVRRGQVIAIIDATNYIHGLQQAQASYAAAQSTLDQARIQAQVAPEQSKAAVAQAEAGLESAKARLALVRSGAREQEKARAKEAVNAAKAGLDKANADLERARRLYAQDAIAKADVDAAEATQKTALANYQSAVEAYEMAVEGSRPEEIRQAEEAVRQAEEVLRSARAGAMQDAVAQERVRQAEASLRQAQAQVRIAQTQLDETKVTSPIDGFVSGTPARVGQVVQAGTPVATVVGLQGVYFEGMVPETEISKVRIGQVVSVRVDSFPDRVFDGTVIAISPEADPLGRLFATRIALGNAAGLLKPGMFARGSLVYASERDAVSVPVDAVLTQDGKSHVFVADGDKAKRVSVTLGAVQDGWVQVIGLSPSYKVILGGKDQLSDGTPIRLDAPRSSSGGVGGGK